MFNCFDCFFIYCYFVEISFDEIICDVFDLFVGLDKEVVVGRDFYRNVVVGVMGLDVEVGVVGVVVDGEEIEVGMEVGEDGVFGVIFDEVGSGGSKKVRIVKMIMLVLILCSRRFFFVFICILQYW